MDILNSVLLIFSFFFRRVLKIAGRDCRCLEQLVDKFANTLETFSLFLIHYCNGKVDQCFNSHRLAALCSRLSHLRTLHFAILGQSIERPRSHTLSDITHAFCTPFWLDGPLGRIRVCVDYHQVMGFVQMFSLPYTFPDAALFHIIDLIDVLFNTNEDEKEASNDLSIALRPLWRGMIWLIIFFLDEQKIPISFLCALQSPDSQGELIIFFFMYSYPSYRQNTGNKTRERSITRQYRRSCTTYTFYHTPIERFNQCYQFL